MWHTFLFKFLAESTLEAVGVAHTAEFLRLVRHETCGSPLEAGLPLYVVDDVMHLSLISITIIQSIP